MRISQTQWERALEVHAELTGYTRRPEWNQVTQNWLTDRFERYGLGATAPSAFAFGHLIEHLEEVEPIYVTEEMQELTYEAMQSFDSSEPCTIAEWFIPSGLALLDEPFLAADINGRLTSWRVISWRLRRDIPMRGIGEGDEVEESTETTSAVEIFLWYHRDDPDDYKDEPESRVSTEWMRRQGLFYSTLHATTIPLDRFIVPHEISNEGDPKATWVTFLRVLQRLMAERIVLKTRYRPQRAVRRRVERAGIREVKDVLVVELRRPRERGFEWDEGDGEPIHYSHRFLVSGHWRNQWYPSERTHRQKWIPSYVKGPADAPLKLKKKVWVWDR